MQTTLPLHSTPDTKTTTPRFLKKAGATINLCPSPDEVAEYQQLLYSVYCEELGWVAKERHPSGRFVDPFDDRSSVATVRLREQMVAGMKIVRPENDTFPHEHALPTSLPNVCDLVSSSTCKKMQCIQRDQIREVARTMSNRKTNRVLVIDLVKILHWFAKVEDVKLYFMVIDMDLFLLCHKIGFPIEPVGMAQHCEGSWTIPGVVLTDEIIPSITQTNAGIASYIMDGSNVTTHTPLMQRVH